MLGSVLVLQKGWFIMITLKKLAIFLPVLLFPTQLHADESPIDCLTKNIYFEAKNQSIAGQIAVALVVLNRVKDKRFPKTICAVIYEGPTYESWKTKQIPDLPKESRKYYPRRDRCQFSWYCDGKSDNFPKHDEEAVMVAHEIADAVIQGNYMDYTGGALFYHADYVLPSWAKQKEKTIEIDDHIFYRFK